METMIALEFADYGFQRSNTGRPMVELGGGIWRTSRGFNEDWRYYALPTLDNREKRGISAGIHPAHLAHGGLVLRKITLPQKHLSHRVSGVIDGEKPDYLMAIQRIRVGNDEEWVSYSGSWNIQNNISSRTVIVPSKIWESNYLEILEAIPQFMNASPVYQDNSTSVSPVILQISLPVADEKTIYNDQLDVPSLKPVNKMANLGSHDFENEGELFHAFVTWLRSNREILPSEIEMDIGLTQPMDNSILSWKKTRITQAENDREFVAPNAIENTIDETVFIEQLLEKNLLCSHQLSTLAKIVRNKSAGKIASLLRTLPHTLKSTLLSSFAALEFDMDISPCARLDLANVLIPEFIVQTEAGPHIEVSIANQCDALREVLNYEATAKSLHLIKGLAAELCSHGRFDIPATFAQNLNKTVVQNAENDGTIGSIGEMKKVTALANIRRLKATSHNSSIATAENIFALTG